MNSYCGLVLGLAELFAAAAKKKKPVTGRGCGGERGVRSVDFLEMTEGTNRAERSHNKTSQHNQTG